MRGKRLAFTILASLAVVLTLSLGVSGCVTVTPKITNIKVGETAQLSASSTLTETFTWNSSDPSIASVDHNGLVTGRGVGVVRVSATGNRSGRSDNSTVIVKEGEVATVTVSPSEATLQVGATVQLSASSIDPLDISFTWTSTNEQVAAVDSEGLVTAVSAGSATITATGVNSGEEATAAVTVTAVTNQPPTTEIGIDAVSEDDIAELGLATGKSSGVNNVAVGTDVYLNAAATDPEGDDIVSYSWAIDSAPAGSQAVLAGSTDSSIVFTPDIEGTYTLSVAASDSAKGFGEAATQVINAGTYLGAGIVNEDASGVTGGGCAICHNGAIAPDKFTPWLGTKHATRFSREIDGEVSNDIVEDCIRCHTAGYDLNADNGGFDDVQAGLGWTWPASLADGNWNDMATNYGDLAALANVQCENCHGPGSQHPSSAFAQDKKISVTLDAGVCGFCHIQEVQWERSGHSDADSRGFQFPTGPGREECAICHTGQGYIDASKGVAEAERSTEKQVHTCAVCHDPHDATNQKQLRVVDSVQLAGDAEPRTGYGTSATCMTCHNGRRSPAALANGEYPHFSTAADVLLGINGADFGEALNNSTHTAIGVRCVACHMARSPGASDYDGILDPGENKVGEHTFNMIFSSAGDPEDGFSNVDTACGGCHAGLDTYNRGANGDYDGDGTARGVQEEVQGLLALVAEQIEAKGAVQLQDDPYVEGDAFWNLAGVAAGDLDTVKKAVWNYTLVANDGSFGIHNTAYSVGLLQLSYKQLAGDDIVGAVLRY